MALLIWSAPLSGYAQSDSPLRRANEIYETGDIDAAIDAYQTSLEEPGNPRRDVLLIHQRLGLLLSATGDTEAAERHFAIVIAMAPDTPASSELSPAQRDHWEETRANQQPIEISFTPLGTIQNTETSELQLEVRNAPAGAVARVRVLATGDGNESWSEDVIGTGPSTFILPRAAWHAQETLQIQLQALDEYGGLIAESRTALTTAVVQTVTETRIREVLTPAPTTTQQTSPQPDDASEESGSLWTNPWFWTITGALLVGGTTATVLMMRDPAFEFDAPQVTYRATP